MDKSKIQIISLLLILAFVFPCSAEKEDYMRGVWVSTVYSLDYPNKRTTDSEALKKDALEILDNCAAMGFNAVFLQVRPSADALYKSGIFPMSRWLTGKAGLMPDNGFDPLGFWVSEAHKRGIELHAWINPYRITVEKQSEFDSLPVNHPAVKNPSLAKLHSNGNYYFNPALPEVRELIISGAEEIVRNYAVDGIHMDDYFYPGEDFPDSAEFAAQSVFSDIGDFRRDNVNLLIKEMGVRLKAINPAVSFGISPFGIWANEKSNPLGSATSGNQSYYSHYADTKLWALSGWVDYLAPQIYWYNGQPGADYEILLNWWQDTLKDAPAKLYIGLADYKIQSENPAAPWYGTAELRKQLCMNKTSRGVMGEIHFRYKIIAGNRDIYNIIRLSYADNNSADAQINYNRKIKINQGYFAPREADGSEIRPVVYKNSTYLPLRAMTEAFGASVRWDEKSESVYIELNEKKAPAQSEYPYYKKTEYAGAVTKPVSVYVNGKILSVSDAAGNYLEPLIIKDRVYLPLRAVSEALGLSVAWLADSETVCLSY